jgi:hypothetical protein
MDMEIQPRDDWADEEANEITSSMVARDIVAAETKNNVTICFNSNCPPNSIYTDFKQGRAICTSCGSILPGNLLATDRPRDSNVEFEYKSNQHDDANNSPLPDTVIEKNKILPKTKTKKDRQTVNMEEIKAAVDDVVMNILPADQRCYFVHADATRRRYSERIIALGNNNNNNGNNGRRSLRVPLEGDRSAPPVVANKDMYHTAVDRIRKYVLKHYQKVTGKVRRAYKRIALVVCWQLLAREQHILLPLTRLASRSGMTLIALQTCDKKVEQELTLPPWTKLDAITGCCCYFFSFYPKWNTTERSCPSNADLHLFVRYVFSQHTARPVQTHATISQLDSIVNARIQELRTGRISLKNRKINYALLGDRRCKTFAAIFAYLILRQRRNGFGKEGTGNLVISSFLKRVGLKRVTFQDAKKELLKWL